MDIDRWTLDSAAAAAGAAVVVVAVVVDVVAVDVTVAGAIWWIVLWSGWGGLAADGRGGLGDIVVDFMLEGGVGGFVGDGWGEVSGRGRGFYGGRNKDGVRSIGRWEFDIGG